MKGKVAPRKSTTKATSRSVFPFPLLFRRLSTVFFIDSELNETIPLHFRNVFRFWLDVSFFPHVKKYRSRFWLDLSFFSRVKTIVRSSDWLELICTKIYDIAFWWVFLSMYVIKYYNQSVISEFTYNCIGYFRVCGWNVP